MTQKYLRQVNLALVSNGKKTGIDCSNLHFTFTTTQFALSTGNHLMLRLYDLDEPNVGRVMGEFTDIILNAGYEENPPTLFEGTIVQVRRGWEGDKAERYIDITAMDGDRALAYQIIADAIPNGSTYQQRWAAIVKALNLPAGQVPTLDQLPKELQNPNPRGATLFGAATDAANEQAMHMMCTWSIQNGRIVVIPYHGDLPGAAPPIDINGATGMIGWPEQTDEGVHVQCLLDARLFCHQRVRINNFDTLQQQLNLIGGDYAAANLFGAQGGRAIIAADGIYRIVEVTHSGDTRGNEWYSDLVCLADDPHQQPTQAQLSNGWA
jgi:hypothetical protein